MSRCLFKKSGGMKDRPMKALLIMAFFIALHLGAASMAMADTTISANWTLQQNENVAGNLYITAGIVNLNGFTLTVEGNLIQSGGTMNIGGGTLSVTGDYRIQSESAGTYTYSQGYLIMTNTADHVIVGGRFVMQSTQYHSGRLTAGVMEVKGDFTQLFGSVNLDNFNATVNHKVILNGDGMQTVSFANPGSSGFNILEIDKQTPDRLVFASILPMNTMITHGYELQDVTLTRPWTLGEDTTIGVSSAFRISNNINLNGKKLTINGNLIQSAGILTIGGGTLSVTGDYRIQSENSGVYTYSQGYLIMTNTADHVIVGGRFVMQSTQYHSGRLTAGVMEVKGDFTQLFGSVNLDNFNATVNHKVILNGDGMQTVSFANPGSSGFNILEIDKQTPDRLVFASILPVSSLIAHGYKLPDTSLSRDLTFTEDTFIEGILCISANIDLNGKKLSISGDIFQTGGAITLNGGTISIGGNFLHSAGTLTISGGTLNVAGDYRIQSESSGGYTYSQGYLIMTNTADHVIVGGRFVMQSTQYHSGRLTAGMMEVKGDFTQLFGSVNLDNFNATVNHKVILNGDGMQTVSFANPGSSGFNILEIDKQTPGQLEFTSSLPMNNMITHGYELHDVTFTRPWTMNEDTVIGTTSAFRVSNNINLNGKKLTIHGNLIQSAGILTIGGGTLSVTGDYRIQSESSGTYTYSQGYLIMTSAADHVIVSGRFVMQSTQYHSGRLTAGVMEVKGDFAQLRGTSNSNPDNFNATFNHKVILNGPNVQTISFENNPSSRFNTLVITKSLVTGYVFTCPTPVWNTLTEDFSDQEPPSAPVLSVAVKSHTFVTLAWEASTDNVRVDGYEVCRDGVKIAVALTPGYTDRGLLPGQTYVYTVRAYDSSGNAAVSEPLSVSTDQDQASPSVPTDLSFTDRTETSLTLVWQASTDDVGVAGYEVYRDGEKIAEVAGTSYSESGLAPGVSHVYTVKAYDLGGNRSVLSAPIYFDNQPPTAPTELAAPAATENTITLTWAASTDDMIVVGYDVYKDGVRIGSTEETNFVVTGLMPITTHVFTVRAIDGAGNASTDSAPLFASTEPDLTAPTAPANPAITARTQTSATLSWQASTDNVGVAGYEVFRDGEMAGTATGTTYTDFGLTPGVSHTYTVKAFDAGDNRSVASTPVYFDNQAPSVPDGLTATAKTATSVTLAWTASTDDTGVTGYEVYRDGVKIGTSASTGYTAAGLAPETAYVFTIRAYDAAGNTSAPSEELTVETISDTQPPSAPGDLRIAAKTGSTVTLAWSAAVDNVGVTGYEVYRDGVKLTDMTGTEYTDTGLAIDTEYQYTIKAFDAAGNLSAAAGPIKATPIKPRIIRLEPGAGTVMGGMTSKKITVYFTNYGDAAGTHLTMEYSSDGVAWTSMEGTVGPFVWDTATLYAYCSWDLSPLASGEYSLRCTVYDVDDFSDQKIISYIVDRTAPGAPQGLQAVSECGRIMLTWTPPSDGDLTQYRVYRATSEAGPFNLLAETSNTGVPSYYDTTVQSGITYYYKLAAVDRFNQEGEASNPASGTAQADNIIPSIFSINPASGSSLGTQAQITVQGRDNLGLAAITLQYSTDDGASWIEVATQTTQNVAVFTWNTASLTGPVKVRALARDAAGNISDGNPVCLYNVDVQGPAQVTGLTVVPAATSAALKWNAVADQDLTYYQVEQRDATGVYQCAARVTGLLRAEITGLVNGREYWFRVVAYDLLGNRGTASVEVKITTAADVKRPTVTGLEPAPGFYGAVIPLKGKAADDLGVASFTFEYSWDQIHWSEIGTVAADGCTAITAVYDWNTTALPEGACYVRGLARDAAGNVSNPSGLVEFRIDRTAPSGPTGLEAVPAGGYITLNWTQGSEVDLAGYRVYRAAGEGGPYTLIADKLAAVTYRERDVIPGQTFYYKVAGFDRAGNESPASGPVSGILLADAETPKILSIYPAASAVLGKDPRLSVLASDNYRLAEVTMAYRRADDPGGAWVVIGTQAADTYGSTFIFAWTTSGLADGSYTIRVTAKDQAGNGSEPMEVPFTLNTEPPTVPVVTAVPGGCRVDLTWTSGDESDLAGYIVYRGVTPGGPYQSLGQVTEKSYSDAPIASGRSYYYVVEAMDRFNNVSRSIEVRCEPLADDPYPPTSMAGDDQSTIVGKPLIFDGGKSKDNVDIESYTWDFGDNTGASGMTVTHIYTAAGTYDVTLTVRDAAGNEATDTCRVTVRELQAAGSFTMTVRDAGGVAVAGATIVAIGPDGVPVKAVTDDAGGATLTCSPGQCTVSIYKDGFTPITKVVNTIANFMIETAIRLDPSSIVEGQLTVARMTLDEIMAAGIDVDAPENQYIYKIGIILSFVPLSGGPREALGGLSFNVYGTAGNNLPPPPPPPQKYTTSTGQTITAVPRVISSPRPEVPPNVMCLIIKGSAHCLKEFFEVELSIHNTAPSPFDLHNGLALLAVPAGLSLVAAGESPGTNAAGLDVIAAGSSATQRWVVRGDSAGTYKLTAGFSGILAPFGEVVNASFEADSDIRVWGSGALTMHVVADEVAEKSKPYNIMVGFENISDITIYNFGGKLVPVIGNNQPNSDPISVNFNAGSLEPGQTYWVKVTVTPDFDGRLDKTWFFMAEGVLGDALAARLNEVISNIRREMDKNSEAGDPVDTSTGAQVIRGRMLSVNGARPISVDVCYYSLLLERGPLGVGWNHSYETYLTESSVNGGITIHWDANHYNVFRNRLNDLFDSESARTQYERYIHDSPDQPAVYTCFDPGRRDDRLVKNADGTYTLYCNDQKVYLFRADGRLAEHRDKHGRSLLFTYDGLGRLAVITEPISGQTMTLAYGEDGLIASVQDRIGRKVIFTHNTQGHLTAITDASGRSITYTYDAAGHVLTGTDDEGRKVFANTLDDKGRVVAQDDGVQGNLVTRFTYVDDTPPPSVQIGQSYTVGGVPDQGIRKCIVHAGQSVDEEEEELPPPTGHVTTTVTDRNGKVQVYEHNNRRQLLRVRDAVGNNTSYSYDTNGNVSGITDPKGNNTRCIYDWRGNVVSIIDATGKKWILTYDVRNNLLTVQDPLGKVTRFSYDEHNNLIELLQPNEDKTIFTYENGFLTKVVWPRGGITTYLYDGGLPVKIIDPTGNETIYTYDGAGRPIDVNEAGLYREYLFDGANNLLELKDALNNKQTATYDSHHNILTLTDAKGNITRFVYDANGNLTSMTDALGRETKYEYDGEDRLIKITNALNNTVIIARDDIGRVTGITDGAGHTTHYAYDALDNLTGVNDAYDQRIFEATYNYLNKPVTTSDAFGNTYTRTYDELGRLTAIADPVGRNTQLGYDDLDRLVSAVDALNGQSGQVYDADGNLTAMIDPNGNRTSFGYDPAGRLISVGGDGLQPTLTEYGDYSLPARITNGRGQVITCQYDAAGRLVELATPTERIIFTYDANGNVLTVTNGQGTITRVYDALDRVISYTDAAGNTIGYEYDAVGNLVTLTYPGGKAVRYEYDADGHLTKVTDWAGRVTVYTYDNNGRLIKTVRPNGTVLTLHYDEAGRLVEQTDVDGAGNVICRYVLAYDAAGNVVTETGGEPGAIGMNDTAMTYQSGNRIATYMGQTVLYDADGNMILGPLGGVMAEFQYDALNKLISAGDTYYVYDAEGNRIGVIEGGLETQYVVNPHALLSQVLMEIAPDGSQVYYLYGLGLIGQENPDGKYLAYHFNTRGDTVVLTDVGGQITDRFSYDSFGGQLSHEGESKAPFLFCGEYGVICDNDSLYYMRMRYYNSAIGRFLNQDALVGSIINSSSMNSYSYSLNNPIIYTDPWGLAALAHVKLLGKDCELGYLNIGNKKTEVFKAQLPRKFTWLRYVPFDIEVGLLKYKEKSNNLQYEIKLLSAKFSPEFSAKGVELKLRGSLLQIKGKYTTKELLGRKIEINGELNLLYYDFFKKKGTPINVSISAKIVDPNPDVALNWPWDLIFEGNHNDRPKFYI